MEVKDNILFLKPVRKGYGITSSGHTLVSPYREVGLFGRILREICFRIPFFPYHVWYNKKIKEYTPDCIVLFDPLITTDFCLWLSKQFPSSKLNYVYGNLIGKARHILPKDIPSMFRVWTFDRDDSIEYGIMQHDPTYFDSMVKPKKPIKYDVLYVGADKGRGEYLMEIKSKLEEMGLRTKFIIVKDSRFAKKKPYYSSRISYSALTDLITESRAILNVALPGQVGVTMRDMEALFFKVKLITTNKEIVNADFYTKDNIYILDNLQVGDIPKFINTPIHNFSEEFLEKHSFNHFIKQMKSY